MRSERRIARLLARPSPPDEEQGSALRPTPTNGSVSPTAGESAAVNRRRRATKVAAPTIASSRSSSGSEYPRRAERCGGPPPARARASPRRFARPRKSARRPVQPMSHLGEEDVDGHRTGRRLIMKSAAIVRTSRRMTSFRTRCTRPEGEESPRRARRTGDRGRPRDRWQPRQVHRRQRARAARSAPRGDGRQRFNGCRRRSRRRGRRSRDRPRSTPRSTRRRRRSRPPTRRFPRRT